jgi:hypothetical protein
VWRCETELDVLGGDRNSVAVKAATSMLVMLVLVAGCGGSDEASSLSPEETAQAWVEAINAEDYERACDLSVFALNTECVEVMEEKPFGQDLQVEGFSPNRDKDAEGEATFTVSSSGERKRRSDGWTAYAPTGGFIVERGGDAYLVHFEISVIK